MLQSIKFSVSVAALLFMPSIALAQAVPQPIAPPPSETMPSDRLPTDRSTVPNSAQIETTPDLSQEPSEGTPISCPAGQFVSKFSDVTPDDWAYEAVNRLASGQFRCFPFSSQS